MHVCMHVSRDVQVSINKCTHLHLCISVSSIHECNASVMSCNVNNAMQSIECRVVMKCNENITKCNEM